MPRGVTFTVTLTPAQYHAIGGAIEDATMDAENHRDTRRVALLGRASAALSRGWWA